jgi:decaprenylphospho-beta-D-ribofuranose 2-oxidase
MSPTAALRGIPSQEERLGCYSGRFRADAHLFTPASRDELRRIFAYAAENGRRVTLRAGAHSFDAQALGDDIVVSMARFDGIEVDPAANRVVVGPGATWGAIVAALKQHGKVPYATVTTEHATAGGTLSGDCLSRFSPAYGKEGTHVESFEVMLPTGEVVDCRRPPEGVAWDERTREERLFLGTIGGLGYLGAVLSITYSVLPVGDTHEIGVRTTVRKAKTFADLAARLVPVTQQACVEHSTPADPRLHDAIYSAMYARRARSPRVLIMTSSYATDRDSGDPAMLLFKKPGVPRVLVEWLIRWRWFNALLWWFAFRHGFKDGRTYDNTLEGFAFFMDGNALAKRLAARARVHLQTLQQTFVVPVDLGTDAERTPEEQEAYLADAREPLARWLEHAQQVFEHHKLIPTFHDVLFLPQDLEFPLSATSRSAGFAVSYAFETRGRRLDAVVPVFEKLADDLWRKHGGRVYLVKNVCAKPAVLKEMYGEDARRFFALKREVDPAGILRNGFLEGTFGDALRDG